MQKQRSKLAISARSSIIWGIQKEKGEGKNGIPSIKEAAEYPLSIQEKELVANMEKRMIIGNPKEVREKILELREKYKAGEVMINTNSFSIDDRIKSYQLISKELLLR